MNDLEENKNTSIEYILKNLKNLYFSFDYIKINIASPFRIKSWSQHILPNNEIIGEVSETNDIHRKTKLLNDKGLYSEKIFGPIKNWECQCGKYKGFIFTGICEICNIEIIDNKVRRYRMGYIDLKYPVIHSWYYNNIPNYLLLLIQCLNNDFNQKDLYELLYLNKNFFKKIFINDINNDDINIINKNYKYSKKNNDIIDITSTINYKNNKNYNENNYYNDNIFINNENNIIKNNNNIIKKSKKKIDYIYNLFFYKYINEIKNLFLYKDYINLDENDSFNNLIDGIDLLKILLENLNIKNEIKILRSYLDISNILFLKNFTYEVEYSYNLIILKKIRILESFLSTNTNPSWLILTILPILPPELRPLIEVEDQLVICSDINELYRKIISRNNTLNELLYNNNLPIIFINLIKKELQNLIDNLFYSKNLPNNKIIKLNNKPLKSLTELLEGKYGHFRHNILGKRVDYSGRSVIIVNPNLRLNQCGLPYYMLKEIFNYYIINKLYNIVIINKYIDFINFIIDNNSPLLWAIIIKLIKKNIILLNRAPSLHKYNIQGFNPILTLGNVISLHPLLCTGFNADFDGDQMALHLPLYYISKLEIYFMLKPSFNIISCSNNKLILKPSQDIIIGCYYLTIMLNNNNIINNYFSKENDVLNAYYQKKIDIHTSILINYTKFNSYLNVCTKNNKLYLKNIYIQNKKIYNIYINNKNIKKIYILTNIGIFVVYKLKKKLYYLTSMLIQTTPGRIILKKNINFSKSKYI